MQVTSSLTVSDSIPEPLIKEFPTDTIVREGETILFQVVVEGDPPPVLTWYFNGKEVASDYSTELREDGGMIIPSVEPRHAGVYKLVATNDAGSVSKEVSVTVLEDDQPNPNSPKIEFHPIPVHNFGEYVVQGHAENNKGFNEQFEVQK